MIKEKSKNLEIKVKPSRDVLRFFCVENAPNIIGCGWYDTKYCLKSCKFYENKVLDAHMDSQSGMR